MSVVVKSPLAFLTGATYGSEEAKKLKTGVYLGLFHGRNSVEEELNDWGFDGPVIGPLKYVHTTYANRVRFCPIGEYDSIIVQVIDGMIELDGKFYGDWTVFFHEGA